MEWIQGGNPVWILGVFLIWVLFEVREAVQSRKLEVVLGVVLGVVFEVVLEAGLALGEAVGLALGQACDPAFELEATPAHFLDQILDLHQRRARKS